MEKWANTRNSVLSCLWILAQIWLVQGEVFCRVPSAQFMADTQLTCFFQEDVRQSKRNIAIFHHSDPNKPEKVVDCPWLRAEMYCTMEAGYEYVQKATSNFSVKIRQVSRKHVGMYECQLNGSGGSDAIQCKFSLIPGPCVLELNISEWTLRGFCIFASRTQVSDARTCSWFSAQGEELASVEIGEDPGAIGFRKSCSVTHVLTSLQDSIYTFRVRLTSRLQNETNSITIVRPRDLYSTCPPYVPEGGNVSCQCAVRHQGNPSALVTWVRDGAQPSLSVTRADRQLDQSALHTCFLLWPNANFSPLEEISYTLRIAYGPLDKNMAIEGPLQFVANGSQMTLTCTVREVHPTPQLTWTGVTCQQTSAIGQCVFVPDSDTDNRRVVSCTATNPYNKGQSATASFTVNLQEPEQQEERSMTVPVSIIISIVVCVGIIVTVIVVVCVIAMRKRGALSAPEVYDAPLRHVISSPGAHVQHERDDDLYEIPCPLAPPAAIYKGHNCSQSWKLNLNPRGQGNGKSDMPDPSDYLHPVNEDIVSSQ